MSQPFLGEIKIVPYNFAPKTWAMCNGQQLPINQNQALFSLLGTTYGGNGQTTFALPDFRGKVPISFGAGFTLGQTGGQNAHTVTESEMPSHIHFFQVKNSGASLTAPDATAVICNSPSNSYGAFTNGVAMAANLVSSVGGSQPHENRQPFLVLTFIIALVGIFPSQN
ncbi:MAG: phage tail protein [Acidobacteria bacterium]|nr:phage tail protein [Acidobacteriota bacterium]